MKAIWNDQVLVESDDIVIVENNPYFPMDAIRDEFFVSSEKNTRCPWKGKASYYSINVDGKVNPDAAWYYPAPKSAADNIRNRVAFWRGVEIVD